jgi:hypothetical protein
MKTEEENGAITRIIDEVVASNEIERNFLNYKLKIIAKFEVDDCVELANHEFKNYEQGQKKLECEVWFSHHEDNYNPEEIKIEDGWLQVVFSLTISSLLSNSLNEHSVQDLIDYILGTPCLYVTTNEAEYEPIEEPLIGVFEY